MAEFPALPLWTDAYLADTRHLKPAEHGHYLLLLMEAWRRKDCALPDDDELLARLAGCDLRTWKRHRKKVIMAFWKLGPDGSYRQERLTKERKFVDHKSNKNRASANARWLKNKDKNHANAMPDACVTDAPTPTPTPTKEIPPNGGCQNAARSDPLPCQQAFENWNKIAEANGLPKATKLTEERRRHLKARLREFGLDGWNEALWKIEGNKFFHGDNDRGWTATLDFLLRPSKFARVLEGGYDRKDCEA